MDVDKETNGEGAEGGSLEEFEDPGSRPWSPNPPEGEPPEVKPPRGKPPKGEPPKGEPLANKPPANSKSVQPKHKKNTRSNDANIQPKAINRFNPSCHNNSLTPRSGAGYMPSNVRHRNLNGPNGP